MEFDESGRVINLDLFERRRAIANFLLTNFFDFAYKKLSKKDKKFKDLENYKPELQLMLEDVVDSLNIDTVDNEDEWDNVFQLYYGGR